MGGGPSTSGVMTRVAPTSRACWRRTAEGSLTVMSEIPWARNTATSRSPTGPAPMTSTRSSGPNVEQPQRVQGDGRRLGQRRHPRRQGIGNPDQVVGRHRLVLAEGAAVSDEVGRGHGSGIPKAGLVDRAGTRRTPEPGSPPPGRRETNPSHSGRAATMPDHSWPRMAPGFGVPLQDHVQVGAADAALGDLHEHLAGPRLGTGHLLDGDSAVAHVDGGRHQW